MTTTKKMITRDLYDKEIASVLDRMSKDKAETDEYTTMVKNLEVLARAKSYEKDNTLKPEHILPVAANLAGILLILNYEQAHVITSKALSFIFKVR